MPNSQVYPFVDYIPAQVSYKKICRIFYYVLNPISHKLERRVIKCNKLKNRSENMKFARLICENVNKRLQQGWNPFIEEISARGYISLKEGITQFINVKSKELRNDSLRSYRSYITFFNNYICEKKKEDTYICLLTSRDAENFIDFIYSKNISNKTYNNYLRFYKTLFLWFLEKGYIKENPFEKLKTKREDEKIREGIPEEVRKQIRDYLFKKEMIEYYYVIQLCFRCFIRPKEIMMLKMSYINYREKILTIPATVAKNHKTRIIALPGDIFEFLLKIKDFPQHYYIFSDYYKPGMKLKNSRDTGRTWATMRQELNLPMRYTFYSLKDTGITEMLEKGVPAKLVKELADHHSLEMTEKYTHKSSAYEILKYNTLEF